MANNEKEDEHGTLSSLFNEGFGIFSSLETSEVPTNSETFQNDVNKAIEILEDVTKTVSSLGLFGSNEDIDEVATIDIKYLLLPALLGSLCLKQLSENRNESVRVAQIYFRDFLLRLKDYGMIDFEIPPAFDENIVTPKQDVAVSLPDIVQMTRNREDKIKKYKQMKELESKIMELKSVVDDANVDDEIRRDYYLALTRRWIQQALDDLSAIEMELPLLKNMAKLREGGGLVQQKDPKQPLKPIIITRDAAQKKIYGLGYPSVPTMTVDEFYEQKVKEGTFTIPDMSLQAHASGDLNRVTQKGQDEIDREIEAETDNTEALRKKREWDDWKDDHRRGWGNRKNKS